MAANNITTANRMIAAMPRWLLSLEFNCYQEFQVKLTKLDLIFLSTNLIAVGAMVILIVIRGPSIPGILLGIGAAGLALRKLAKITDVMSKERAT